MLLFCVREKKQTESVTGSEKYEKTKYGRLMLKTICASCGITKSKFVELAEQSNLFVLFKKKIYKTQIMMASWYLDISKV